MPQSVDLLGLASRPATNADAPRVRELVFSILSEYNLGCGDPDTTDSDLFDIEAAYPRAGGCFDVFVDPAHDGIVGCVGLYRHSEVECELRKMYLHRDYRGRGLGGAILEHAIERARDAGFKHVVLETATVLKEAIGLYVRFGFKPMDDFPLCDRCDQAYWFEL